MTRRVIPAGNGEAIYMEGRSDDTTCWAHDRPTEGLGRALVDKMREMHGRGGVNVCVPCISRAKSSVAPKAGGET